MAAVGVQLHHLVRVGIGAIDGGNIFKDVRPVVVAIQHGGASIGLLNFTAAGSEQLHAHRLLIAVHRDPGLGDGNVRVVLAGIGDGRGGSRAADSEVRDRTLIAGRLDLGEIIANAFVTIRLVGGDVFYPDRPGVPGIVIGLVDGDWLILIKNIIFLGIPVFSVTCANLLHQIHSDVGRTARRSAVVPGFGNGQCHVLGVPVIDRFHVLLLGILAVIDGVATGILHHRAAIADRDRILLVVHLELIAGDSSFFHRVVVVLANRQTGGQAGEGDDAVFRRPLHDLIVRQVLHLERGIGHISSSRAEGQLRRAGSFLGEAEAALVALDLGDLEIHGQHGLAGVDFLSVVADVLALSVQQIIVQGCFIVGQLIRQSSRLGRIQLDPVGRFIMEVVFLVLLDFIKVHSVSRFFIRHSGNIIAQRPGQKLAVTGHRNVAVALCHSGDIVAHGVCDFPGLRADADQRQIILKGLHQAIGIAGIFAVVGDGFEPFVSRRHLCLRGTVGHLCADIGGEELYISALSDLPGPGLRRVVGPISPSRCYVTTISPGRVGISVGFAITQKQHKGTGRRQLGVVCLFGEKFPQQGIRVAEAQGHIGAIALPFGIVDTIDCLGHRIVGGQIASAGFAPIQASHVHPVAAGNGYDTAAAAELYNGDITVGLHGAVFIFSGFRELAREFNGRFLGRFHAGFIGYLIVLILAAFFMILRARRLSVTGTYAALHASPHGRGAVDHQDDGRVGLLRHLFHLLVGVYAQCNIKLVLRTSGFNGLGDGHAGVGCASGVVHLRVAASRGFIIRVISWAPLVIAALRRSIPAALDLQSGLLLSRGLTLRERRDLHQADAHHQRQEKGQSSFSYVFQSCFVCHVFVLSFLK